MKIFDDDCPYDPKKYRLEVLSKDGHIFEVDKAVFEGVPSSHKRVVLRDITQVTK